MGMYTEFFFRAHIKKGAPIVDWLDGLANGGDEDWVPYDEHPFFTPDPRGYLASWEHTLTPGGAVYQITRPVDFRRSEHSFEDHELVIHSSAKSIDDEGFVDWIAPYLEHEAGDFLGYTLFEDSRGNGYWEFEVEQPSLIFRPKKVRSL